MRFLFPKSRVVDSPFFERLAGKHPARCFRAVIRAVILAALLSMPALVPRLPAAEGPVTVTKPLMRYGLGTLACAAYSPNPDIPLIATGGGIGAVIWNAETGEQVRILSALGHYVKSVAFSPDGTKVLTGSEDYTAKLWNASTGTEIRTFSGHTRGVYSVAFSPDGTRILTGSADTTAKLWDASTGAEIRTFLGHTSWVESVDFSPDGTKVLTGSYGKSARLWDASTGLEIRTFSGHTSDVNSVAFSPDGTKVLTGSRDKTVKLWNAETGTEIRTFSGHTYSVNSVAFSPDGTKVLTGSVDKTARLWDASTGNVIRTFAGHTGGVFSVAFSPDGTKVLTGAIWPDSSTKLWDASTGAEIRTFFGHVGTVLSGVFSPNGTKVLTGGYGYTKLWNAGTGAEILTFSGYMERVFSVAFSPDGTKALTGCIDSTAKLWNAETGALIRTFSGHTSWVVCVAFSPDGTKVLTGSGDRNAKLWNTETGALIRTFSGHTSGVESVAFSPDGTKVLTGGVDKTAKLWDTETGVLIHTFSGHTSTVTSVAFSPDGTKVLTGSGDYTAKLWDASTGVFIGTFAGHALGLCSVAFSPNGTQVLTGSIDKTAKLWNTETRTCFRSFFGHTSSVFSVAFSPDGTKILTGGNDGLTFLWGNEITDPAASSRKLDKLILVAGGGVYNENTISSQTKTLAELAHRVATIRGYALEDIYYLSAFDAPTTGNNVDAAASSASFQNALTTWAADASRLTIILIGPGRHLLTPSEQWRFILDGRKSPRDYITASQLKTLLDAVQSGDDPLRDVALLVDACYSGGFMQTCSGSPAGTNRLIFASTSEARVAAFPLSDPTLSFSGFFLLTALEGETLFDCFIKAKNAITALNLPPAHPQSPRFDDNGDGLWTVEDGEIARGRVFGRYPKFGFLIPEIEETTGQTGTGSIILGSLGSGSHILKKSAIFKGVTAGGDLLYNVECRVRPGPIRRVRVVALDTEATYPPDEPIVNLDTQRLARVPDRPTEWTGEITVPPGSGDLNLVFIAEHDDSFDTPIYGAPAVGVLRVPTSVRPAWFLYE